MNVQSVWKRQSIDARLPTAAEIRERAQRYARRNRTESIVGIALSAAAAAGGLVAVLFVVEPAIPRVILAAAIVLIAVAITREMQRAGPLPASDLCVEFYRKVLTLRRRQVAISIDLWGAVAGLIVLLVRPLPGLPWYFYALLGLALAAMFAVRLHEARKAGRELAALDAMR